MSFVGGFAVGGMRAVDAGMGTFLALVGPDAASGRLVDLGGAHGTAGPPRLASHAGQVFAAVPGTDASGGTLRLAVIRDPSGKATVTWGAEVEEGWDESAGFDLGLGRSRGVLVWDRWTRSTKRSTLQVATFALADISVVTPPAVVLAGDEDVEGPRLAARPQGFWLAFLSHSIDPPKTVASGRAARQPRQAPPRQAPPRRAPPRPNDFEEGTDLVVDLGKRWLQVVPLDEDGKTLGPPLVVSKAHAHVQAFDIVPGPEGGALLAWRDDDTSPGVEAGRVELAVVRADGSVMERAVESGELGSGSPSLLVADGAEQRGFWAWLAVASEQDATMLAAVSGLGELVDVARDEAVVGRAEPLTLGAGRVLLARSHGRSMELSVVACRPGPPPQAVAAPSGGMAAPPEPPEPEEER